MIFKTKPLLKMVAISALTLGMALTLTLPLPSEAQTFTQGGQQQASPNAEKYDEHGIPYDGSYWKGSAIYNTMALIRKPELGDDQFILRFSHPSAMSTCVNVSNFGFEASYTEHYLDITVTEATIDGRNLPLRAHYECDLRTKMPVADVVLSRDTLLENGTKTMRLHAGTRTNYYNVDLSENRILLLPDSTDVTVNKAFRPAKLPMRNAATIYWFYPMGTLVLWTPQETDTEKAAEYIAKFALRNGLIPITEYIENFKSPLHDKRFQYYVDTAGKFDDVAGLEDGAQIGHITVETVEYGLQGDEVGSKDIMVFARIPGMYD